LDELVIGRVAGKIAPAVEIVRQEIICVIGRDDVSVTRINQRKRPAGRADIYRLPKAIQHQDLTVQQRVQDFPSCSFTTFSV
jgi:hypothetical protein